MKDKTHKPKKIKAAKNSERLPPPIKEVNKTMAERIHDFFKDEQAVLAYSLYGEILFEI